MKGVERIRAFVSALPQGDVLVSGAAATAAAIAEHGVHVVLIEPAAQPEGERRSGPPGVIRRPLGGGTLLPYPPGVFAGCWLTPGSPVTPAEARRLLRASGVLVLAASDPVDPEASAGPGDGKLPPVIARVETKPASASGPGARAGTDADCVFCPEFRFWFNHAAALPGAAGVLWGDEDLFVVCDLAPLADGHLLVVTTDHYACMGACPERLWAALAGARERIAQLYGEVYGCGLLAFEHGPARPHAAGACIDHAHLHCLPARVTIRPVLEAAGLRGEAASPETLRALYTRGVSYLYVEEEGTGRAYLAERLRRQFLRWAVTEALRAGHDGAPPTGWRWQETFGSPASRRRHMATLERLLASVDSHQ